MELTPETIVFLIGVGGLTLTTAITDYRWKRIPNKVTVPAFALGLVYQVVFNGFSGLLDGLLGFAVGFGLLLLIWLVGSGGGGDVKLMGALSVWLGFRPTLYVLAASTVVVITIAVGVFLWSVLVHGSGKAKRKYLATGKPGEKEGKRRRSRRQETVEEKQSRRITAYAIPVAIATWFLVLAKPEWIVDTPATPEADDETADSAPAEPGDETDTEEDAAAADEATADADAATGEEATDEPAPEAPAEDDTPAEETPAKETSSNDDE